jgi:endonuclease/exonuclease/phosphatase family metal-dependent hydrolase
MTIPTFRHIRCVMRIATYNVESLFERPVAFNQATWEQGRPALEAFAALNALLEKDVYTPQDKEAIVELLKKLGLGKADDGGKWARLRQNRGKLLKRPPGGDPVVVASGRADWLGWVELEKEPVRETAMQNTARVLKDVAADIQAIVEAESRIALKAFSDVVLPNVQGARFEHVMLVDGNDERGIDVGIMTRAGYEIESMRSHVDDTDAEGIVFSRDCAEYSVRAPSGKSLLLLINHLKSKGYGGTASSNAKRLRQATRIAEIYTRLRHTGLRRIVVVGDFNDTPESAPLEPLLGGTDLKDISEHPLFTSDGRPGTFDTGRKGTKFDYLLFSPDLFDRVLGGGVWRMGVWGGKNGTLWPHYAEMKRQIDQGSDHAAVYADFAF